MPNLRRNAFIKAYLGEAHGNATKAAELAGYSSRSAKVTGCRLLTDANVQRAIGKHLDRATIDADQALANVSAIADTKPSKVSDHAILKANELILKVHGRLAERHGESRVTVNIGFLTSASDQHTVMAFPEQIVSSREDSDVG